MKSPGLGSLQHPSSGRWRARVRQLAHANRRAEPKGYSFDDSRHPVWAIANGIAVFFLGMSAVAFLVLMADAFLTRH
jgi:hypothetical protein